MSKFEQFGISSSRCVSFRVLRVGIWLQPNTE